MFRFENPDYFYLLLIIPIITVIFVWSRIQRKRKLKLWGDARLIDGLIPDYSPTRPTIRFIVWNLAIVMLIIAAANPQIGSKLVKVKQKGIDMMICLDVSNSMLAQDIKPNRLENAKLAMTKLVDQLKGDRLGIIVFAGKAYVQLPLTSDYAAARMFISKISTNLVPTQGTAIADAIRMAHESLTSETRSKAIIIMTDGEDHEGNVIEQTEKAVTDGIRVYTLGIGSPEGAPIPMLSFDGSIVGYRKDKDGNTIMTRLDEVSLQKIASTGNGVYVRSANTNQALRKIFEEIGKLEKTEFDTRLFSEYDNRFYYFLWIALVLLITELFISLRKSKLWSKLNLFGK